MRWHYDLTGAEPIIRDVPVYDASSLAQGELLMLGTNNNNTADGGISGVTAGTGTAANDGVDVIGMLDDDTYESTTPSRVVDNTSGVYLGRVIINPFAVYLTEYNNGTSYDIACEATLATTGWGETLSTIGANGLDGYWVLLTDNCATSALQGDLRMITANTASAITVPTLSGTPTTSDLYIFANPPNANPPIFISGDARDFDCASATLDAPEGMTNFRIITSYAKSESHPMFPLHQYNRGGTSNIGSGGRLFADLVCLDHIFNPDLS